MFHEEKEVVRINRVKAVVKDVKVTNKGIQLNLEKVQLTGEQISEISALVAGMIYIDIEERLPESKKKEVEAPQNQISLFDTTEDKEEMDDQEVMDQLELN